MSYDEDWSDDVVIRRDASSKASRCFLGRRNTPWRAETDMPMPPPVSATKRHLIFAE